MIKYNHTNQPQPVNKMNITTHAHGRFPKNRRDNQRPHQPDNQLQIKGNSQHNRHPNMHSWEAGKIILNNRRTRRSTIEGTPTNHAQQSAKWTPHHTLTVTAGQQNTYKSVKIIDNMQLTSVKRKCYGMAMVSCKAKKLGRCFRFSPIQKL